MTLLRRTLDPGVGEVTPWRPLWVHRIAFCAHVVAWLSRRMYRLTRWAAHNWVGFAAVAGLYVLLTGLADRRRWNIVFLLLMAAVLWVTWMPRVFEGQRPVQSWRRKHLTYARHWQPVMLMAGLSRAYGGRELLPKIVRVRSTDVLDQVTVKVIEGQVLGDYVAKADRLAEGFGAVTCLVQPGRRRRTIVLQLAVPGLRDLPVNGQW
jgi:DNA segregation ATPase FtsK/SpoIIIE, S-DNA-T family